MTDRLYKFWTKKLFFVCIQSFISYKLRFLYIYKAKIDFNSTTTHLFENLHVSHINIAAFAVYVNFLAHLCVWVTLNLANHNRMHMNDHVWSDPKGLPNKFHCYTYVVYDLKHSTNRHTHTCKLTDYDTVVEMFSIKIPKTQKFSRRNWENSRDFFLVEHFSKLMLLLLKKKRWLLKSI